MSGNRLLLKRWMFLKFVPRRWENFGKNSLIFLLRWCNRGTERRTFGGDKTHETDRISPSCTEFIGLLYEHCSNVSGD